MVRPINPINTQPPIAMLEYRIGLDKTRSSVLEGLGISERKCQISEKKVYIERLYDSSTEQTYTSLRNSRFHRPSNLICCRAAT